MADLATLINEIKMEGEGAEVHPLGVCTSYFPQPSLMESGQKKSGKVAGRDMSIVKKKKFTLPLVRKLQTKIMGV